VSWSCGYGCKSIGRGEGRIVATSLYNYAMPFIRYDTGDSGHIIDDIVAVVEEINFKRVGWRV